MRDYSAWVRSLQMVRRLERLFGARIVFGHDREVAMGFLLEKRVWE
jgi:glyoxylase-like metal-dependent hydrolase (beta-lactamase superfamily II)